MSQINTSGVTHDVISLLHTVMHTVVVNMTTVLLIHNFVDSGVTFILFILANQ